MSDELIGGMIKGAVIAISLSLIGLLVFYVLNIIKKVLFKAKKTVTPLTKAVYNHSKDIVSEIKPAINEYKEKHTSKNNDSQNNNINIDESKIYEDIMLEIEQDNKVKSTWAKALSQGDGNRDKSESLYIKMRFEELKYHQSYQKEELNLSEQIENIEIEKEVEERVEKEIILNKEEELKKESSSILAIVIILFILILISNTKEISTFFTNISSPTTNETLSKESTYSSKVENNTMSNEKLITSNKIEKQENTNKNSFQTIFEYKDWKYDSFDNFFRITTNGKVGAPGHEFGILRRKDQCNNNFIWMTFSTMSDISSYIGENIKFKITIDDTILYQELPIFNVTRTISSLNIAGFSNFSLNDYSISLLKKGKKLKVEILETNKLYDKFDIKFEEFSLEGFVANYMKLDEKCSSSDNKILFEYVQNNDYGAGGLDRTYKLTKNGKSCIYNYSVGSYNGVINDSCTGEYKFKVRDDNGNFIQNNNTHWSPLPYHDAFKLINGNEMKINQKMISKFNSKNELIYCLEDMSICKTEKELKTNSNNIIQEVSSNKPDVFKADINDLVINLTDSRGKEKLMKLSFSIKSNEPTIATIIEEFKAEIINVVISQISSRSSEELLTVDGKNLMRDELLQDINNVINEVTKTKSEVQKDNVKQILFTTFVIK